MKKNTFIIILLLSSFISWAQKDSTATTGYLDFNGYNDTRHFAEFTINLMANIPNRVQYFSLTNYQGANNTSDLSTLYSEQNIRWSVRKKSPIDLTLQYVIRSKNANDDLKFGLRWKVSQTKTIGDFFKKLNMFYSINPMLFQVQEKVPSKYMTQIEHVYFINLWPSMLKNKVYLSGFADQNFIYTSNNNLSFKWVTEHQIGINIIDHLFVVAEFRINNYATSQIGLGYGLQYKITY